jgi:hypothetical protein
MLVVWTVRVLFPTAQVFSILRSVQTDCGAHPTAYPVGTGGSFPGVKREGNESGYSPPSSAEVSENELLLHSPYVFMA